MDWHVAYAMRMSIAVDAIQENVQIRTGVKTEGVPLRIIVDTATSVN